MALRSTPFPARLVAAALLCSLPLLALAYWLSHTELHTLPGSRLIQPPFRRPVALGVVSVAGFRRSRQLVRRAAAHRHPSASTADPPWPGSNPPSPVPRKVPTTVAILAALLVTPTVSLLWWCRAKRRRRREQQLPLLSAADLLRVNGSHLQMESSCQPLWNHRLGPDHLGADALRLTYRGPPPVALWAVVGEAMRDPRQEAVRAAAGAAQVLRSAGLALLSGSALELLTAGFCNRVHRARVVGKAPASAAGQAATVVVKQFSGISQARRTAYAAAADCLAGQHGLAPPLVHATPGGVVHRFLPGATLREADLRGGNRRLLQKIAATVAALHRIPVARLEAQVAEAGEPVAPAHQGQAMVWTSIDVMLQLVADAGPDPDAQPVPQERTWSVAAVRAACEAERRAVEARGYPLAVCHGDLKPSNLLHDGRHVHLIDFEIAGPNYRGFDLCKLFRNDAGPVAGQQLRNFLRLYLGPGATAAAKEELLQESQYLEKLTWLEAAVFFMAVLADRSGLFTPAEVEQAERLAEHRWRRYLACTDAYTPVPHSANVAPNRP
eukprot:EG_transcript_7544